MNATALLVAAAAAAGCGSTIQQAGHEGLRRDASAGTSLTPAAVARADSGRPPYTAADVRFMQGMIGHHAQAIIMARWAPTHGARKDVRVLAERIDVAQRDEIATMQTWLKERGESVPEPMLAPEHATMAMPGMLMPGMLTPEQMTQLEKSNGAEFDRLFLTFMIQHHQGALTMVDQLFGSQGAGQDGIIFKFASDVSADQSTEIDRMNVMLAAPATDKSRP